MPEVNLQSHELRMPSNILCLELTLSAGAPNARLAKIERRLQVGECLAVSLLRSLR